MKNIIKFLVVALLFTGCSTDDFLDVKPSNLLIPQTLDDFRLLLDDQYTLNSFPISGIFSDDDVYLSQSRLSFTEPWIGNLYRWKKNIYDTQGNVRDWNNPYKAIYVANTVLNQLNSSHTGEKRNTIEGEALFYRAVHHYNLVSLFAKAYDPNTAATDLGIPIRLTTDTEGVVTRNSVQEVMDQIIEDLELAIPLLPDLPTITTRPSKAGAYGFLARINLNNQNYEEAWTAANESLKIKSQLIDFNTLEDIDLVGPYASYGANIRPVVTNENPEISFVAYAGDLYSSHYFFVQSELAQLYADTDRRKLIYLDAAVISNEIHPLYTGNYFTETAGGAVLDASPFVGISTNEMYLIRAEAYARAGDVANAMGDLNTLLKQRFTTGMFVDLTANDKEEALDLILIERRKELPFRGLRWQDLKRLNLDPNRQKFLTRSVQGEVFTLSPNHPRYVLPIPLDEIRQSKIQQNKR